MSKFTRYIIYIALILPMVSVIHAQSDLMSLTSDINCTSSCWLGIEPGIITEQHVESILDSQGISYEKHPLGAEGSTAFFYAITSGYTHPLLKGNSITIYTNQDVVITINMLLQSVEINDVVAEFGNPISVVNDGTINTIVYNTENLAFGVGEADKTYAFNLLIMSAEVLNLAYLNNYRWDELETCTGTSQLCDIVAAISSCATTIAATDTFTLINADTMQPIQPLNDNDTIDLMALGTSNLTIRANTVPGIVGNVIFDLNSILAVQTDDTAPYDFTNWTPAVGSYTLTATPYSEACGTAGTALTINFTIVDSGACDVNVTASDTAALISAITAGNNAGAPYAICLENSTYMLNAVDNGMSNGLPVITGDITIIGNAQ
jgi:hypothetical protein